MAAAAASGSLHDPLLPRERGRWGAGITISLVAHAALVAALAGAVQWQTDTPNVVAAELWSAVPQVAAPPAPPPPEPTPAPPAPAPAPPPPPQQAEAPRPPPDIAIERAERQRQERERAERERAQKERAQKERADKERADRERAERERREAAQQAQAERAEAARIEEQRQANIARMRSQAGLPPGPGTSPAGTAERDAAPSASYVARIASLIRDQASYPGDVPGNRAAEVEVRLSATGTIISRRLIKSSGHPPWDEAVLRAIDKTARLPADSNGRVPPALIIAFRRNE